ncbi:disks large-associated protein 5 isoform X2 [Patella vulgata]|uniref:disks large-associated protein 5 isoform X2 n=1 Tax=Patella vulgata TaxID=6465 RepID=UPI0024A7ADA7|nr:disks large-associated protein 5 isoform X2 [Patella vulgata]
MDYLPRLELYQYVTVMAGAGLVAYLASFLFKQNVSEPSVLSGASQSGTSKQVALSQDLVKSTDSRHDVSLTKKTREKPHFHSVLLESNKENAIPHRQSPSYNSDSDLSPLDPSRKPSYLKISCAVSGYGSYSQYTSYKDIEKRSPYSSNSSVISNSNSPENAMPSVRDIRTSEDCLRAAVGQGLHGPTSLNCGHDLNGGAYLNGHLYPTGDKEKDGDYFLYLTQSEEDRLLVLCSQSEINTSTQSIPEEASGRIRAAIGKAHLLINKRFQQFRELCKDHQYPDPEAKPTNWEDLQGFWDMVKIQIDHVDDMFTEIELMRNNGWKEIPLQLSRRSSASSSPKSGSLSQNSTPGHTPGTKRKTLKPKETPESSPERSQKAKQAAKARDEARKKLLAEKRAAMKQQQNEQKGVEIYLTESGTKQ